jgi:hypothetical protein
MCLLLIVTVLPIGIVFNNRVITAGFDASALTRKHILPKTPPSTAYRKYNAYRGKYQDDFKRKQRSPQGILWGMAQRERGGVTFLKNFS